MDNKKEKSLTGKTVSGIFWKFGERITAQLVSTLVTIVLARILMPEDYGIIAIVTIFITFCNVFVSSGFGTALVQKKEADEVDFSSVFFASLAIGIILYVIMFFCARPIARFYKNELLVPVIRVMSIRLPLAGINSVQQAYISRKMQYKKFFFSTIIGTIVSGFVGIFMAYRGFGVWSLVAQYLTNVCMDTIILTITTKWIPKLKFSFAKLKVLFGFGWKLLVSSLISTGYNELRSLIIGKKYSSDDLAYYTKAKQFPFLIAENTNVTFNSVLLSSLSKIQDDKDKLKRATRKSIKLSSYILMPCMAGLAAIAVQFVNVILTDKWMPIVPYLYIMCFIYAFYPIHTANLTAIQAMGRSDIYLILEIIKKVVGIISIVASMWFGVFWIAMSAAISTVISVFINIFPNRKLLNYGIVEQFMDFLPSVLLSAIMFVPVFFMGKLQINQLLLLCLQVLVGIVVYILASIITRNESFKFIISYLKKMFKKEKQQ